MSAVVTDGNRCPCGFGPAYSDCCGCFHRGEANAPTAVALMRSRYSAFVLGDVAYLRETWHPSTRPASLTPEPGRRWTRLEVLATSGGGVFDRAGTVEFAAHYRFGGREGVQAERSQFVRESQRWFYLAATPPTDTAVAGKGVPAGLPVCAEDPGATGER